MTNKLTYGGLIPGLSLTLIGLFLLVLAMAVPYFAKAPVLAFLLMSVPSLFSGAIAVLHGIAVIPAKIEITDPELKLVVPTWRVFPMPPVRGLILKWDELLAVRHRKEVYQLLAVLSFPVDVFAIDTTKGMAVLGGRSIPGMGKAIEEIVRRAGLVIQDEGEVEPGLLRSLLKGSPSWGDGREQRRYSS
jgi:hypothetical protein